MSIKYNIHHSFLAGEESVSISTVIDEVFHGIPLDNSNRHYQQYLEHIKTHGMSIVSCDDCGDGVPNDSMWQYLDNAEQLIHNKYHSDPSLHDKMTALREHKYVRAMKSEFPYESMTDAGPIIDSTPKEIKQKYNLPIRR